VDLCTASCTEYALPVCVTVCNSWISWVLTVHRLHMCSVWCELKLWNEHTACQHSFVRAQFLIPWTDFHEILQNPRNRAVLEALVVTRLLEKFPLFYETWQLTVLTTAIHTTHSLYSEWLGIFRLYLCIYCQWVIRTFKAKIIHFRLYCLFQNESSTNMSPLGVCPWLG
jgi:hypothetical protein